MARSRSPSTQNRRQQPKTKEVSPEKEKKVKEKTQTETTVTKDVEYEFGGPIGCIIIIAFSNALLPFFWYVLEYSSYPWNDRDNWQVNLSKILPTQHHIVYFCSFFTLQLILAHFAPGFECLGLKLDRKTMEPLNSVRALGKVVEDKDITQLRYLCNGYFAYYFSISLILAFHYFGIFDIKIICNEWGQFMVAGQIIGNLFSVALYFYGLATDPAPSVAINASSLRFGHFIYDFFMGTTRYPRLGDTVDIKMVAEARWSWLLLMIITLSCAFVSVEKKGYLSTSMLFMCVAHWLYSNATVKGEQYIITTWDMVQEKFGWMLCYWNIAGVPFSYCVASIYLIKHPQYELSLIWFTLLYTILLLTYYMWDTANGQKADFKAGPTLRRKWTFPNFGFSHLKNPDTINTPYGPLLIDGWFAIASKLQYTADILFALLWGLSTGLNASITGFWIPYFYMFFFTGMIIHRYFRDEKKCLEKYKEHWVEYKRRVPYAFIPGVW